MVGYYDLVSKVIVHFELMGQLLMSQLLTSGGILATRSGWFVVIFLLWLFSANIILAAVSLIILTTKTMFLHLFSQPASLSGSALGLLVQFGKSFLKGEGTGWS